MLIFVNFVLSIIYNIGWAQIPRVEGVECRLRGSKTFLYTQIRHRSAKSIKSMRKSVFKRVSLLKFSTLYDFAYAAHFPSRNHIILKYFRWANHSPEILSPCSQGDSLPWKTISKILFYLGEVFSWPKYGNAPAAASRAVMLCDMAFGVQCNYEKWWEACQMKALTQQ